MALNPVIRDDDHLAILNLADKARADNVKRAGLRCEDCRVPQFPDNERPDAQGIANADKPFSRQRAERISALNLLERVQKTPHQTVPAVPASRDQMR